jgi:hypothetical protein
MIASRLLKEQEFLASPFDRLRMRRSILNGCYPLMVSLSNHGQHRLFQQAA